MKIAIVGSRDFPMTLAGEIVDFIGEFPDGTTVMNRNSLGFDQLVKNIVGALNATGRHFTYLDFPGTGGPANFIRDVELVREADQVYAFFSSEETLGTGGTQHVVDKALDQRKPVESYCVIGGHISLVGSEDHREDWAAGHEAGTPESSKAAGKGTPKLAFPGSGSSSEGTVGRAAEGHRGLVHEGDQEGGRPDRIAF